MRSTNFSEHKRPLVSLIIAVRNEIRFIDRALCSLLQQEAQDFDLEILVVDGCSTDGTAERIKEMASRDSRIRLVQNSRERTPFAFNLGIREAQGEYVCIMGAHSEYEPSYVSTCFQELRRTGAIGCSGQLTASAANPKWQARLVARAIGHPFGTSPNSMANQREGFRETIPYPLFVRQALIDAGGYDERLYRNQDNDMNKRLRVMGHKLYLTGKTHAKYFQKPTLVEVMAYSFRKGFWNVISLRMNRDALSLRHFVPAMFVSAIIVAGLLAVLLPLAAPPIRHYEFLAIAFFGGVYLSLALAFATIEWCKTRDSVAPALPAAWFALHTSYGCGSLWALVRNANAPVETTTGSVMQSETPAVRNAKAPVETTAGSVMHSETPAVR
jgi:succinoglycan biosynthesis protein ExoA